MVATQGLSIEVPAHMVEAVGIGTIITMAIGIGVVGMAGEFLPLFSPMASLFLLFHPAIQRLLLAATPITTVKIRILDKCRLAVL